MSVPIYPISPKLAVNKSLSYLMLDESAVGDLFSPSVEDSGVVAEAAGAAAAAEVETDVELVLDLGGDSARNGLSCLAVVSRRDLGDRGEDPARAAPALEGEGPGDPGESFLLPRDLVIPGGRREVSSGVPLCSYLPLIRQVGSLSFPLFRRFFAVLLLAAFLPLSRTGRGASAKSSQTTKSRQGR